LTRLANLTSHSARLSPVEVARLWFRKGPDFAALIQSKYPDFPKPCPDGLYVLSHIAGWFDRFQSGYQSDSGSPEQEEAEFMRAVNGD
jgi:hypothetical protein